MVLIAIDKYSRKILGYLCKNDETVAYCCSECDFEFASSSNLEKHMVKHEKPSPDTIQTNASNDEKEPIEQNHHEETNDQANYDETIEQEEHVRPDDAVNDAVNDAINDPPLNASDEIDKEKQLQLKYQVKFRFISTKLCLTYKK